MNDEKLIVNGSLMNKNYFEENLKEAQSYKWTEQSNESISEHQHCIICQTSLPDKFSKILYHSKGGWLCKFCHDHYLNEKG